jgi:hypothetical protein
MKFVKLSGQSHWYEWEEFNMKLRNFKGGWRDIDENSDEWMLSTIMEADSWHDFYVKTGFNLSYLEQINYAPDRSAEALMNDVLCEVIKKKH